MPSLLMRSRSGTLLEQTCARVVDAQVARGRELGAPWGVSESAYARLDAHQTYQYRLFGVPGLGFKRGLSDDKVVAPYASILAASLRPRVVLENVARLEAMGMLGTYGLFEALDLRPERAPDGRPRTVVRSYMAHHQGMIFVALDNCLHDQIMVDRFHADARVKTGGGAAQRAAARRRARRAGRSPRARTACTRPRPRRRPPPPLRGRRSPTVDPRRSSLAMVA